VACLVAAAAEVEADAQALPLVVTTDRTSNGPLLVYPRSQGMGGSPATENWVLDSFAADPNTGKAMVATAENVARDGAMSRAALDELTLLRWQQYQAALADDRRFQRRYCSPVVLPRGKGKALRVEADEGRASLHRPRAWPPSSRCRGRRRHLRQPDASGRRLRRRRARRRDRARTSGRGRRRGAAALGRHSAASTRQRCRRQRRVPALLALRQAEVRLEDVRFVVSHNPFAVNDLWFAQQTGFPLERMNPYGCSLIYGHPRADRAARHRRAGARAARGRRRHRPVHRLRRRRHRGGHRSPPDEARLSHPQPARGPAGYDRPSRGGARWTCRHTS
jgi:acetyl-CoA C-acetyltransferase